MRAETFATGLGPIALMAALAAAGSSAVAQSRGGGVQSQYTSLAGCPVLRFSSQDVGFREVRCPGVRGHALKVSTSDGRDELALILPDRSERRLGLTRVVGSGFATIGRTAEWRVRGGPSTGVPTAVIVRTDVSQDPQRVNRRTSYLVVTDLAANRGCIVGRIAPGPRQNLQARRLADEGGRCLSPGS